ncbi:MAG: hypothetical protein H7333_01065 [Bdellovibrionales bacterium]|nr:hypothetical protein [Oligoflexia bacterium]
MIFFVRFISRFPFWALHRISDGLYFFLFYVLRYRRKIVLQNLHQAFPLKSPVEIAQIEKKFYQNFCDIMVESIKYITIPEAEFRRRLKFVNLELPKKLYDEGKCAAALCGHLGNWDTLGMATAMAFPHEGFGVYKPLSNKKFDDMIIRSRGRFGMKLVSIQKLRSTLNEAKGRVYAVGLMGDQAPHHYDKSFQFSFLNQTTYVTPGPGVICVQRNMTPVWVWMKRTERSCFELGFEELQIPASPSFSETELEQIRKIAQLNELAEAEAIRAFLIVKEYTRKLELQIQKAPADWLWSHRRWKTR